MSDPFNQPRKINLATAVGQRLKELAQVSEQRGIKPQFVQALKTIEQRLRTRPLPPQDHPDVFGEPCYRLRTMQLLISKAVVRPLVIFFGVSWSATLRRSAEMPAHPASHHASMRSAK